MKPISKLNTHTQTPTIAKRRACTHTHTDHKSQTSHQHIHARTHKQIQTRNLAVISESMTVSWLTGKVGLKQLNGIGNVMSDEQHKSDYDHPSTLITITSSECK